VSTRTVAEVSLTPLLKKLPKRAGCFSRCDHRQGGGEQDHQIFIAAASNACLVCSGQSSPCFSHTATQVTAVALEDMPHTSHLTPHSETPSRCDYHRCANRKATVDARSISTSQSHCTRLLVQQPSPKVIYQPSSAASGRGQGGNYDERMALPDAPNSQHRGGTICATDAKSRPRAGQEQVKSRSKARMSQPVIFRSA
jgi:hypothetical protein